MKRNRSKRKKLRIETRLSMFILSVVPVDINKMLRTDNVFIGKYRVFSLMIYLLLAISYQTFT